MTSLNTSDIIGLVAHQTQTKEKDVKSILDSMINIIKQSVANGHEIQMRGFGKFTLKELKEGNRRNPKTGETILSPRKEQVKFKPANVFKNI